MFPARQENFTRRDLAAPLFRRKRALILTFLFVFAVLGWAGLLRFHRYEAHMAILLSPVSLDPVVTTDASTQMVTLTPDEVNSAAELLKSRDLLEQVVLANGIEKTEGVWPKIVRGRATQADRVAAAVRALANQIEVETPVQTNLIDVTYRSADPARAYGVLNSLGNLYVEKYDAGHQPHALGYNAALQDAEAGLQAMGQTQGTAAPESGMAKAGGAPVDDADVDREAKADEQNYLQYLSQREQERASGGPQKTKMENVAIAIPPAIPVLPMHSAALVLLIALVSALAAGVLAAYLFDYLDPFFHTPAQVTEVLGIPIVVAVPKRTA